MIRMGEIEFGNLLLKNPVSTEHTIYGLVMIVTNPLYTDLHNLRDFFEIEGADIYTEQPIVIMNNNGVTVDDFLKIHAGMTHLNEAMCLTEDDELEVKIIDNINRTIRYARYIDDSNYTIFDIIKNGGSKFIDDGKREAALTDTLHSLALIAKLPEIKLTERKKECPGSEFKVPLHDHSGEELYTAPKMMTTHDA